MVFWHISNTPHKLKSIWHVVYFWVASLPAPCMSSPGLFTLLVVYNNFESYNNLELHVVVRNLEIDVRSVNPANTALQSSKIRPDTLSSKISQIPRKDGNILREKYVIHENNAIVVRVLWVVGSDSRPIKRHYLSRSIVVVPVKHVRIFQVVVRHLGIFQVVVRHFGILQAVVPVFFSL